MNWGKLSTKIKLLLADLPYVFKRLPKSASLDVPYYCQFMSADLVEKYISDKPSLSTDPKWRESGAKTIEEYQMWTWSDCGITCFKMILSAIDKKYDPLTLVELCKYVKEKFNLNAKIAKLLTLNRIKDEISRGNFVIISVHPSIRFPDSTAPAKRGGHLVLVVGYDEKGIYIHNPSGYKSNNSQERAFVKYEQFKKFFANRGIVIKRS